jgi:hypothetical protein
VTRALLSAGFRAVGLGDGDDFTVACLQAKVVCAGIVLGKLTLSSDAVRLPALCDVVDGLGGEGVTLGG